MRNGSPVGHFVVHIPHRVLYGAAAAAIVGGAFWLATFVSASSVIYAPSSCTGDWVSPHLATTLVEDSLFSYRDAESAALTAAGQSLFCAFGGVTAGETRAIRAAHLVLHFVPATYRETDASVPEAPIETAPEPVSQTETASTSDESAVAPVPVQEAVGTDAATGVQESSSEPRTTDIPSTQGESPETETAPTDIPSIQETESVPPPPAVEPAGEQSTEPASAAAHMLDRIIALILPTTYAEETASSSGATTADGSYTGGPGADTASSSAEEAVVTEDDSTLITVSYSTDASGWKDLGSFSAADLVRDISIPLPLSTAADIESLVVRLRGEAFASDVYLDAITLDITYEDAEPGSETPGSGSALASIVAQEDHAISVLDVNDATVFAILDIDTVVGLYRVSDDGTGRIITEIAGAGVSSSTDLFLKEGWVFWVAEGDMLHAYDAFSGSRHTARLAEDDAAGDVIALIPAFPMTVVWRNAEMYFWTPEGTEEQSDARSGMPTTENIEALDLQPTISVPLQAPPEEEAIRPVSTHACSVSPFSIPARDGETLVATFTKSELVRATARIGDVPAGLVIRFRGSGSMQTELPEWTKLTREEQIEIESVRDMSQGDYTIPIVFTQHGSYDTETVCQFNVVR